MNINAKDHKIHDRPSAWLVEELALVRSIEVGSLGVAKYREPSSSEVGGDCVGSSSELSLMMNGSHRRPCNYRREYSCSYGA